MTPRWDYSDHWIDPAEFLGGTSTFDIYVDCEGYLRLANGYPCNENWHWVEVKTVKYLRKDAQATTPAMADEPKAYMRYHASPEWCADYDADIHNVMRYISLFAPDWRVRAQRLKDSVRDTPNKEE